MKDLEERKRRENVVLRMLIYVVILQVWIGCAIVSNDFSSQTTSNGRYRIKYLKSKEKGLTSLSHLRVNYFDYQDSIKEVECGLILNGDLILRQNTINILPGTHDLLSAQIGKESIEIKNLKIERGDSVIVNFYLKNSNNFLY